MKITASRTSLGEISDDVLIVPVFEGETPRDSENAPALAALDHLTRGAIASVFEDGEMTGKRDRWVLLHNGGQLATKRLPNTASSTISRNIARARPNAGPPSDSRRPTSKCGVTRSTPAWTPSMAASRR